MYLSLNHQRLTVFVTARELASESYKLARCFPSEEKFCLYSQIKRAAVSVYLNIAEGASGKSGIERKRFYEIARGSLIEVDAALDLAFDPGYLNKINTIG